RAMGWLEYLEAVHHKLEIARFHVAELEGRRPFNETHRVAVQAHFEGVLYSFVAASDQLAQAINIGFSLGIARIEANIDAVINHPRLPLLVKGELQSWNSAPIVSDVRAVRV